MSPIPKLSLVIAVYNKPDNLRFVLAACGRQSFADFEVIVADDGSEQPIREVIKEASSIYSFPINHFWHEDNGWRKNVMMNNAIRFAHAEHLVFIDGDSFPASTFFLTIGTSVNREECYLVGGLKRVNDGPGH